MVDQDTRDRSHDLRLLSDVFDAAYRAMSEARISPGYDYAVTVENIAQAAKAGAEKVMREIVAKARSKNG